MDSHQRDKGLNESDRDNAGQPAAAGSEPVSENYNAAEKRFLLELARRTLIEAVSTGRLPAVVAAAVPSRLVAPKACFVTLTVARQGTLRGCIGHLTPHLPLYQAVMENTRSAATRDTRFPPVRQAELDCLRIEISVLTELKSLTFATPAELLGQLRPGIDGVVLRIGDCSATFLPQVWTQIPAPEEFLSRLCLKAGVHPGDWRRPDVAVSTYAVQCFGETES